MCLRAPGGPETYGPTFDRLEEKLLSLHGRKFYGLFRKEGDSDDYFACTNVRDYEDPSGYGFMSMVLPRGIYARKKIVDWEEKVDKLTEYFDELASSYTVDNERFGVEFYRSMKELYIMLPIK